MGYQISGAGSVPRSSKVQVISKFPKPEYVKSLQEFMGIIILYHQFIPNATYVLRPLYPATKPKSQTQKFTWAIEISNALNNTKRVLAHITLLAHHRCDVPISPTSGASDRGVVADFEVC